MACKNWRYKYVYRSHLETHHELDKLDFGDFLAIFGNTSSTLQAISVLALLCSIQDEACDSACEPAESETSAVRPGAGA